MDDSLRIQARRTRAEIASGALRGPALLERLLSVSPLDRDAWLDEVLRIEGIPSDIDLPRGSAPYLPSGVDDIVTMVRDVPLRSDDRLVDLGAGLGRVVILAHLLSGIPACGVEIQHHLVHSARERCAELALTGVSFVHANAADVVPDGSIFFLYAPFSGEMRTRAMQRLEAIARARAIVVCTVNLELHDTPWLTPRKSSSRSLALYESHIPGVAPRLPHAVCDGDLVRR